MQLFILGMAAPLLLPLCLKLPLMQARSRASAPKTSSQLCCQARGIRQPSPLTMWQALTPASSSSIEVRDYLPMLAKISLSASALVWGACIAQRSGDVSAMHPAHAWPGLSSICGQQSFETHSCLPRLVLP